MVVDDSPLIREIICDLLAESPGIEVAGTATDGSDAVKKLDELRPDVITLDFQMPKMDGLETLDAILAKRPTPVIMVSAQTQRAADTTLAALDHGALDYLAKPEGSATRLETMREELIKKIRAAAGTDVQRVLRIRSERRERMEERRKNRQTDPVTNQETKPFGDKCLAIGISTGGPPALTGLFEALHPPMPPIVIVQHMPAQFTSSFAERLNSISDLSIKEAATGDVLKPNHVFIAPGGTHLHLAKRGAFVKTRIQDGDPVSGHKPSVDVMMQCAAEIFGDRCLGVIMTGMGRDGVEGCQAVKAAGGYVLGQDQATSDVYGMNKAAFVEGHVNRQFALQDAATVIRAHMNRLWNTETRELAHQA